MRPITITTKYQQIRHGSRLAIAIGVVGCALVAPAGASAVADYPVSNGEPQASGDATFSSVTALSPPSGQPSSPVQRSGSDYSTVSSITGHDGVGQAPVSASTSSPSNGFDWSDAGIGAAIAILLAACATVGVLVQRRRHTLSPTA